MFTVQWNRPLVCCVCVMCRKHSPTDELQIAMPQPSQHLLPFPMFSFKWNCIQASVHKYVVAILNRYLMKSSNFMKMFAINTCAKKTGWIHYPLTKSIWQRADSADVDADMDAAFELIKLTHSFTVVADVKIRCNKNRIQSHFWFLVHNVFESACVSFEMCVCVFESFRATL